MSEVKLGRVAPIYKGVYDETTAYNALDIVYYNGRSYMAKQDTKGNALPTGTDNDYWGLIVDKGPQGPKGDKGDTGLKVNKEQWVLVVRMDRKDLRVTKEI